MKWPHFTLDGNNTSLVRELQGLRKRVNATIEYTWQKTGVDANYLELLRQALPNQAYDSGDLRKNQERWVLLPGLCCDALGETSPGVEVISAAWYLFYAAAHIMDTLQDMDEPDVWWRDAGTGIGLSCASGLFFTATSVLQNLNQYIADQEKKQQICDDFNRYLLMMCSGQYMDLKITEQSLAQFWEMTQKKSGAFFALACRSGARLSSTNLTKIEYLSHYGIQIGIIVQVLDELEDWHKLTNNPEKADAKILCQSLPYFYTIEVIEQDAREKILSLVRKAPEERTTVDALIGAIESAGAAIYILTELEKHKEIAKNWLVKANPQDPAREKLIYLIDSLFDI